MATQMLTYYGSAAAITATFAGLAYTAGRETDVLTCSTTADDYQLIATFKTSSGQAHAGDYAIYLYACPSPDGTGYPSPAAGTDAAITISTASNNLKGPILVISYGTAAAGNVTNKGVVPSLKAALGTLPQKLTFAVQNNCALLTATAGDHSLTVVPVWYVVTT